MGDYMRIRETEPIDVADGVRSVFELDGATVWVDHPVAVTADDVRAELVRRAKEAGVAAIAEAAEARRSAITAAAPGKQGAYLLKYELVLRAESGTDETAKSQLAAEATARGLTYEQLRDVIVAKRAAWEAAAMAIETVEAASKAAVAAAADRASVDAAVNTAKQLLAEIGG